jgi:hypothetical protein
MKKRQGVRCKHSFHEMDVLLKRFLSGPPKAGAG